MRLLSCCYYQPLVMLSEGEQYIPSDAMFVRNYYVSSTDSDCTLTLGSDYFKHLCIDVCLASLACICDMRSRQLRHIPYTDSYDAQ